LDYIVGFLIWTAFGVGLGFVVSRVFATAGANTIMSLVFGFLGAWIGGMLGTSAHVYHDPTPLRIGGLIGSFTGAIFFSWIYHFIARRVV
jgi:uncharacterized membrane protein YeaQ/YmgE (transglycosylase-associated protein family)